MPSRAKNAHWSGTINCREISFILINKFYRVKSFYSVSSCAWFVLFCKAATRTNRVSVNILSTVFEELSVN